MENLPAEKSGVVGETKRKRNPVLSFFVGLLSVVLVLALLVSASLAFCAFDKKSSLAAVPRNYSFFLRSESAFDTLNPLFDLDAADVFLSSPDFALFRKYFMDFRASSLRDDRLFRFAARRPVDFAVYGKGEAFGDKMHFVAVVNLGIFSLFSRVAQYMYPKVYPKLDLHVENLSYVSNEQTSYFVYEIPPERNERGRVVKQAVKIYFKSVKNLFIASDSYEHFLAACLSENDATYTSEQKQLFKGKARDELRIIADSTVLLSAITEGNPVLSSMAEIIDPDSLSVVSFNINDSDVAFKCRVPASSSSNSSSALEGLLSRNSTTPSVLTRFSDVTQYYTVLNAGTLEELKDVVLPFMPEVKKPDEFWNNCDEWSRSLLGMDLREFLFSWSGNEFAVLGVENQNDPVFVLQVRDEKQRQKVFNKLTDSILVKEDNSLIVGGVRIPRLDIPSFLSWALGLFGINLPSPYFIVLDGNIYFSESPESLSAIYTNAHSGKMLVKNKDYVGVSKNLKNDVTLSLFYNLERSVPFFLRSKEIFSKVLQLYSVGRFDVRVDKNIIEMNLHACARKSGSLYSVPGFPISLDEKVEAANFQADSGKHPRHVYWVENGKTIKSLDITTMKISSRTEDDKTNIVAAAKCRSGARLWTVDSHGLVSLLTDKLEPVKNFPMMLGDNISCRPCSVEEKLVVVSEHGKVYIIRDDASVVNIDIPGLSAKSEPVALENGNSFVIYSKGFLGKIYYFEDDKCVNLDMPLEIPGIALGSPSIIKSGSKIYVGFITQAGEMNVWRVDAKAEGVQADGFPMRLGGVFMTNVVASDKYFYALSNDALLYRISLDGEVLSLQIPNSTAKEGYICVRNAGSNGRKNVYVCADANVIYGFNENMELLSGYPLTGWGKPLFVDVNGDKTEECLALTLDKKLVAWKVR